MVGLVVLVELISAKQGLEQQSEHLNKSPEYKCKQGVGREIQKYIFSR